MLQAWHVGWSTRALDIGTRLNIYIYIYIYMTESCILHTCATAVQYCINLRTHTHTPSHTHMSMHLIHSDRPSADFRRVPVDSE